MKFLILICLILIFIFFELFFSKTIIESFNTQCKCRSKNCYSINKIKNNFKYTNYFYEKDDKYYYYSDKVNKFLDNKKKLYLKNEQLLECSCKEGDICNFENGTGSYICDDIDSEKSILIDIENETKEKCIYTTTPGPTTPRPTTTTPMPTTTNNCKKQEHFTKSKKANDYRGFQNKTISGRTCKKWSEIEDDLVSTYPNEGLGAHNYCRNPNKSDVGLWCYTTDPKKKWEICKPKSCD